MGLITGHVTEINLSQATILFEGQQKVMFLRNKHRFDFLKMCTLPPMDSLKQDQSNIPLRDWSLIMGRGGLQNGKIVGLQFHPPPPSRGGNVVCPPSVSLKLKCPTLNLPPNVVSPPSLCFSMPKTCSTH